jgi:hypothetical protein
VRAVVGDQLTCLHATPTKAALFIFQLESRCREGLSQQVQYRSVPQSLTFLNLLEDKITILVASKKGIQNTISQ